MPQSGDQCNAINNNLKFLSVRYNPLLLIKLQYFKLPKLIKILKVTKFKSIIAIVLQDKKWCHKIIS